MPVFGAAALCLSESCDFSEAESAASVAAGSGALPRVMGPWLGYQPSKRSASLSCVNDYRSHRLRGWAQAEATLSQRAWQQVQVRGLRPVRWLTPRVPVADLRRVGWQSAGWLIWLPARTLAWAAGHYQARWPPARAARVQALWEWVAREVHLRPVVQP